VYKIKSLILGQKSTLYENLLKENGAMSKSFSFSGFNNCFNISPTQGPFLNPVPVNFEVK